MPHAIDIPTCLSDTKKTANIKKDVIIPKAVYKKLSLIFEALLFKTDSNLIDKTGKTHGIKFNIKPPKIDISRI